MEIEYSHCARGGTLSKSLAAPPERFVSGFGDRVTHNYKVVGKKSFVCSIRYATVEGLAIRGVVSRATHPHLFDDKKSRKHRAARSPLVKEESPAKKAKPEVIEIE